MGYYTKFDLEVRTPVTRERAEQIVNRLNAIIGGEDCFELADSEDTTLTTVSLKIPICMKWYDWVEDMSQLANEFPDVEFRLEGNGEDEADWWVALLKGKRGQIKYCSPPSEQIKYCSPPSDEWED